MFPQSVEANTPLSGKCMFICLMYLEVVPTPLDELNINIRHEDSDLLPKSEEFDEPL